MSERALEPGWRLAAMHDPSARRGVWFREEREANHLVALEICGGREGDDDYVRLVIGEPLTEDQLKALKHLLNTSRWMLNDSLDRADMVRNWFTREKQQSQATEAA